MAKIYETKADVRRDDLERAKNEAIKEGDLGIFQMTTGGLLTWIPFKVKSTIQKVVEEVAPNSTYEAGISTWSKVAMVAAGVMGILGIQKIISSYKKQTAADNELLQLGPQEIEYKREAINLVIPKGAESLFSPMVANDAKPAPQVNTGKDISTERLTIPTITSEKSL
mgnify:CR=1 FL=1